MKILSKIFYKCNKCKFDHLIQNIYYLKKFFFANLVPFPSTHPHIINVRCNETIYNDQEFKNQRMFLLCIKSIHHYHNRSTVIKRGMSFMSLTSNNSVPYFKRLSLSYFTQGKVIL